MNKGRYYLFGVEIFLSLLVIPKNLKAQVPIVLELQEIITDNIVTLFWRTATETNNSGFQIERAEFYEAKQRYSYFTNIGFKEGNGTTTAPVSYSFTNNTLLTGRVKYRLKQVDYDGSFEYSDVLEITVGVPDKFELTKNYPNPFNPVTNIKFSLPEKANVQLNIYNSIGQLVSTLLEEEAGYYRLEWNAANLASGIYFLRISAGNKFNSV